MSRLITLLVAGRLVSMYLRTTQRTNRDDTVVRYVQLAHNHRVDGVTQAKVLLNLGREDQLDRDGLRRLVGSINRYLGEPVTGMPADAAQWASDGLRVVASRPVRTVHLLDGLWQALEIDTALRKVLGSRRFTTNVERVLFALVANRAIDPMSKLSAAEWASCDVAIDGLESIDEDQAYRAVDLLVEADAQAEVQEAMFFAVADLLTSRSTCCSSRHDEHLRRTRHRGDRRRRVPGVRALQGPPRRPAADRDRAGRHQGGHPGFAARGHPAAHMSSHEPSHGRLGHQALHPG